MKIYNLVKTFNLILNSRIKRFDPEIFEKVPIYFIFLEHLIFGTRRIDTNKMVSEPVSDFPIRI